jgi:hypothetical protein
MTTPEEDVHRATTVTNSQVGLPSTEIPRCHSERLDGAVRKGSRRPEQTGHCAIFESLHIQPYG